MPAKRLSCPFLRLLLPWLSLWSRLLLLFVSMSVTHWWCLFSSLLVFFFIFTFSAFSSPPCLLSLSRRPLRASLLCTVGSVRAAQPAIRIQCQVNLLFQIFPGLLLSEVTLAEVFIGFFSFPQTLPAVTRSCFRTVELFPPETGEVPVKTSVQPLACSGAQTFPEVSAWTLSSTHTPSHSCGFNFPKTLKTEY